MVSKNNNQFIGFTEKDSEGDNAGMVAINRHQVVAIAYSVVNDMLLVTLTSQRGKAFVVDRQPGELQETKDKEGNLVMVQPVYHGIDSSIEPEVIQIRDHLTIVEVYNALCNKEYTLTNFPGFKARKKQEEKVTAALEQKRKDEEQADADKRKELLANPHLDANNNTGAKIITSTF